MNNLESGLYLPIRFYLAQSEQDRNKRHSTGVALTELNYPYVDCVSLAPFQVSFPSGSMLKTVLLYATCVDDGVLIPLTLQTTDYHEIIRSDGMYFFSYLGTGNFSGVLSNGLHYLTLAIVIGEESNDFYSDLFMIKNCAETQYDTTEYRMYDTRDSRSGKLRLVDATDLRITK